MNKLIAFLALILSFNFSTFYFPVNLIGLISESVCQSEISNDKFLMIVRRAYENFYLVKEAQASGFPCEKKLSGYETHRTVFIHNFPFTNPEFGERNSIIVSDHKTHCEYITLFGKQIGEIPIG